MSEDARFLYQRIKKLAQGEVVTYAELSAAVSRKISGGSPALATARRKAEREDNIVLAVVRGKGLRRLNDNEIVADSTLSEKRIRRLAGRSASKLANAEFERLTPENRRLFTARMAAFAVAHQFTRSNTVGALAAAIDGERREIPLLETLAMFKKQKDVAA